MAHGTRGPIKASLRPSSPSQAAKTVSTKRNIHRTSPPKALAACERGHRKNVREGRRSASEGLRLGGQSRLGLRYRRVNVESGSKLSSPLAEITSLQELAMENMEPMRLVNSSVDHLSLERRRASCYP